jgi:hypothetical protein
MTVNTNLCVVIFSAIHIDPEVSSSGSYWTPHLKIYTVAKIRSHVYTVVLCFMLYAYF